MRTIEEHLASLKDNGPILAKTVGPEWWAFIQFNADCLGFWICYAVPHNCTSVHFKNYLSASTAYFNTVAQLNAGNLAPWITDKELPPRCLRRHP